MRLRSAIDEYIGASYKSRPLTQEERQMAFRGSYSFWGRVMHYSREDSFAKHRGHIDGGILEYPFKIVIERRGHHGLTKHGKLKNFYRDNDSEIDTVISGLNQPEQIDRINSVESIATKTKILVGLFASVVAITGVSIADDVEIKIGADSEEIVLEQSNDQDP